MSLDLPPPDRDQSPTDPAMILAFVRDCVGYCDIPDIHKIEARLYERLRILREREQPCDDIRAALALCEARRLQLLPEGLQARGALSPLPDRS